MEELQKEWIEAKDGFNSGVSFVEWLCYKVIALRSATDPYNSCDCESCNSELLSHEQY